MDKTCKEKMRILAAVLLLAAVCLAGAAAADTAYTECNGMTCVDNCLFIKCDLSTPEGAAVAESVTVLDDFGNRNPGMMLIATPDGMTVGEAVTYYENLPGVLYAEPDYVQQVPDEKTYAYTESPLKLFSAEEYPVNDPLYKDQWGMELMNVPEAWEYITEESDEIVVAVIDTGVNYNHEDLIGNMWTDENGYYGYDFGCDDHDPMDEQGHGTHCAGIIGAVTNNEKGIAGVAQNVKIMAVKIVDSAGNFNNDSMIKGIHYAVDNGADILSMSFGGNTYMQSKLDAIRYAESKGVFMVAAAGNDTANNDALPLYPSSYESDALLSVASLGPSDSLSSFSNYGKFSVDVAAPGGDNIIRVEDGILSLDYSKNDGYVYKSGTSMACPMVAGLSALILSKNHNLKPVELKSILIGSVSPDSELKDILVSGGKADAGNAMKNIGTAYRLVTFVDGLGTEIGSEVVTAGSPVSRPDDPTYYYKRFTGWYAEDGSLWDFQSGVTENMTLTAGWEDVAPTHIDTSWYDNHESETEYTLNTADQLRGLSWIMYKYMPYYDKENESTWAFYGKTIRLGADIDLNGEEWMPIGLDYKKFGFKAFCGTFDGNGHTISNLSINLPMENCVGLFGCNYGKITDLKVEAATITGYEYVGTVCGELSGILENITVTVDTVNGHGNVGGIAGYYYSKSKTSSPVSITVKNGVYGTGDKIGGAFGYSYNVFGNVSADIASVSGYYYVGGMAGYITGDISNCSADIASVSGNYYVGGITGYATGDISNCSADIASVSGYYDVGGITGYTKGDISNCSADIASVSSNDYSGGIAGYAIGDISNCSADIASVSSNDYSGGIAGYAIGDISNCSADIASVSGDISGGIAGCARSDISNCSAVVGNIDGAYAGGAVCDYYPADVSSGNTVKDVFVSVNGNVAGGAIGFISYYGNMKNYKLTIENVLVTGNLTRGNTCGGIVGSIGDEDTDDAPTIILKNCVSLAGKIGTSAEYPDRYGRIYGGIFDKNASVTVENSYGWEGTVNYQGETFAPSEKNGSDILTSSVWNYQKFFENLGWDFNSVWQMNAGNDNFKLPVLQNTLSTGTLDASYLLKHTVHFNANGGTGSMDDQVFTDSVQERLTQNTFTHGDGYDFIGWAESSSGSIQYLDEGFYPAKKSATLYVIWRFEKKVDNEEGAQVTIKDTTDFGSVESVTFVEAPGDNVKLVYTKNDVKISEPEGTPIGSQFEINVMEDGKEVTYNQHAVVSFSVKKSELGDDQVPDVKLAHWTSENRWEYLATTNTSVDDENYQFSASVTGFSPFAIVIKADEPVKSSSSSVTAFFGEKDGSDFTFKRAVVITKATLPGASSATVVNTSGSGWYTCNLSTDGTGGVAYFQVPLDVIDIKGYTVNDVSLLGCKTTYLTSENGYAKYSAVITGAGSYTIDFEKDAAAKAVEKVQEVVEQKQTATEEKQAAAEKVQETVEQKQIAVEQKQTEAKSPFPVLGILAGLGIAGLVALRRH